MHIIGSRLFSLFAWMIIKIKLFNCNNKATNHEASETTKHNNHPLNSTYSTNTILKKYFKLIFELVKNSTLKAEIHLLS